MPGVSGLLYCAWNHLKNACAVLARLMRHATNTLSLWGMIIPSEAKLVKGV